MSTRNTHRFSIVLSLMAVLALALTAGSAPLAAQHASGEAQPRAAAAIDDEDFRSSPAVSITVALQNQHENTDLQVLLRGGIVAADSRLAYEVVPQREDLPQRSTILPEQLGTIAFESDRNGGFDLFTQEVGTNSSAVAWLVATGDDVTPEWSPDGSKIVYASNRDGDFEIYVRTMGGQEQKLTNNSAEDAHPSWSPSGDRIIFTSNRNGDYFQIYSMRADGSDVRQIGVIPGNHAMSPYYSPDGSRIVFMRASVAAPVCQWNWDVWTMAADGSNQRRITSHLAADMYPRWSPDGSLIIFAGCRNFLDFDLYTINLATNVERRLTSWFLANEWVGAYSTDNRHLAFSTDIDGNVEVYIMPAGGGSATNLTRHTANDGVPSWKPAGTVATPTPTPTKTPTPTPTPIPTYTISGRVTDANGRGIPGVTVRAGASLSVTTDANGNYMFTGLRAGTYTLTAIKPGYFALPISQEVTVPPLARDIAFVMLDESSGCGAFGKMADGQPLPPGVTINQIRQVFIVACLRVSNIGSPQTAVHWWQGLLVQDYLDRNGRDPGAIFYDVSVHQGGAQAYAIWGPILERYWSNPTWGPPQSDRQTAMTSPDKTTGHLVRFSDLDVYYNDRTQETYVIRGVTRDRFNGLQGTAGFLGFPKSEGLPAAKSGVSGVSGTYQKFEGGLIYTFALGSVWQAWDVHGAILATHNSLSGVGSGSVLGFPISGEMSTGPSPVGTKGKYQLFEGGRIYYDSMDQPKEGIGTTFVLYRNITQYLPEKSSGVDDHRLGFPIDRQQSLTDCRVFFELGYIDCIEGIREYSESVNRPNLPALKLPYIATAEVYWSGGPHGYGAGTKTQFIPIEMGSGIDFASSKTPEFAVHAMTSGTVVEVVKGSEPMCGNSGLGCRIAIRSDDGGTILIYSHLRADSLNVNRLNTNTGFTKNFPITKGMYIFAGERIAFTGNTGNQKDIHLHIEFRDGTGRQSIHYNYISTTRRKFGYPVYWDGLNVNNYYLFCHRNPKNLVTCFNYDGSAVKDDNNQIKQIRGHYIDPVFGRDLAIFTVHQTFECRETDWDCEAINGHGLTEFAGKGCLGAGCASTSSAIELHGGISPTLWTGGRLLSDHHGTVIAFNPDIVTLESPDYGYLQQAPQSFLPLIVHQKK